MPLGTRHLIRQIRGCAFQRAFVTGGSAFVDRNLIAALAAVRG